MVLIWRKNLCGTFFKQPTTATITEHCGSARALQIFAYFSAVLRKPITWNDHILRSFPGGLEPRRLLFELNSVLQIHLSTIRCVISITKYDPTERWISRNKGFSLLTKNSRPASTGVFSWCVIGWFYFPWNVNVYTTELTRQVTWRFCVTREETWILEGAPSRYFELLSPSTKLPLNWGKPENNASQR